MLNNGGEVPKWVNFMARHRRDDPGQVRGVCGIARFVVSFEDDYVAFHDRSLRKPACFRMLDSVFGFKVALGLPATVTSPGLTGWE